MLFSFCLVKVAPLHILGIDPIFFRNSSSHASLIHVRVILLNVKNNVVFNFIVRV